MATIPQRQKTRGHVTEQHARRDGSIKWRGNRDDIEVPHGGQIRVITLRKKGFDIANGLSAFGL